MNTASSSRQTMSPTAGQGVDRVTARKPLNSCHRCGATAYKTLIARDDTGAMRPSGQYQCVQCKQLFRNVREWRDGIKVEFDHSNCNAQSSTQLGLVN